MNYIKQINYKQDKNLKVLNRALDLKVNEIKKIIILVKKK